MDSTAFTLWNLFFSCFAGMLGAMSGLGGASVLVPILVLALKININYAVGTALVASICTSCGASAAYLRDGYIHTRLAMLLEIATVFGAVGGAWLASYTPTHVLSIIFGVIMLFSALIALRPPLPPAAVGTSSRFVRMLKLNATYPSSEGKIAYSVYCLPGGFVLMYLAGIFSGLLGIGSGAFKVLAMDRVMKLPYKVSTTTSNLMIGVTAAAGAGIYLHRGYISPGLVMPVMLGVLMGSFLGAKILVRVSAKHLRKVLVFVILILAVQMIVHGFTDKL